MLEYRIAASAALFLLSACATNVSPPSDSEPEVDEAGGICRTADPETYNKYVLLDQVVSESRAMDMLIDDCGWASDDVRNIDMLPRVCTKQEARGEVVTSARLRATVIFDNGELISFEMDATDGRHVTDCPPLEETQQRAPEPVR